MNLSDMQKEIHKNAVAHGWWESGDRSFGELIALCHSELSEALEEYRDGHDFTETYYTCCTPAIESDKFMSGKESGIDGCPSCDKGCNNQCEGRYGKPEGIPSELADVVIRIMDMCEHYGIDLEAAIAEKHEFNKTRAWRHNGKKA